MLRRRPHPVSRWLTWQRNLRRAVPPRHARARPSAVLLYGALVAHTLVSAGTYLFAKRALMEIPALPLGLLRFAGAALLLLILLRRARPAGERFPPRREWKKLLFLAAVAVPVNQILFLYGLQLSSPAHAPDRKSTRLNSSHSQIS